VLDLSRVRRLVLATEAGVDELISAAASQTVPVEVVLLTSDPSLERLVETVGDGRDAVIVGSGVAAAAAARRTGADLWDPTREILTPSAECRDDALERLHAENADPWGVETRWYERRKRELVLAMLPREAFERTLELGCSTGALAEALASRSRQVVAVDQSTSAVAAAQRRFQGVEHVEVLRLDVRTEWPSGTFDLVVVSEVGYFMSPGDLEHLVSQVAGSLAAEGVVLLCHWRHPMEGWPLDADAVREGFTGGPLPPVAARYSDRDIEVLVLAHRETWPQSTT
jgi:SAM-dependent methyltransferase